jgi:hypothetical protein
MLEGTPAMTTDELAQDLVTPHKSAMKYLAVRKHI